MVTDKPHIVDEATRTRMEALEDGFHNLFTALEQELTDLKNRVTALEPEQPAPEPEPEQPAPILYIKAADGSFVPASAPEAQES